MNNLFLFICAVSIGASWAWPEFYLWTSPTQKNPTKVNATTLNGIASFDRSKLTIFVIHGFGDSHTGTRIAKVREAILKYDHANVIMVDWAKGAAMPWYPSAVDNTRIVGKKLAQFIIDINLDPSKTKCAGHSLGAHTCGFTGKNYFELTGKLLNRITGLDPAGPFFESNPPKERLDKDDAEIVDCIHTDHIYGIQRAYCQKDFYPNGGRDQPGCIITQRSSTPMTLEEAQNSVLYEEDDNKVFYKVSFSNPDGSRIFGWIDWGEVAACSHIRVLRLYEESMNQKCLFTSAPCDNHSDYEKGRCVCDPLYGCSAMGFFSPLNVLRTQFHLKTNGKEPYCKG